MRSMILRRRYAGRLAAEHLRLEGRGRRGRDRHPPRGRWRPADGRAPPRAEARLDHRARPCLGRWSQRGQKGQALGPSRGGFSTKIHLKTDFDGHRIAFDLTGGEKGDAPHFQILLGLGPRRRSACSSRRQGLRQQGQSPGGARSRIIPHKANEKSKPGFCAKASIAGVAASSRPSASSSASSGLPYVAKKTKRTFAAIVAFGAALSVHAPQVPVHRVSSANAMGIGSHRGASIIGGSVA